LDAQSLAIATVAPRLGAITSARLSATVVWPLRLALVLSLQFAMFNSALAEQKPGHNVDSAQFQIYLTADAPQGIPTNKAAKQFACTDKIYLIVEAQGLAEADDYELAVTWTDPKGKEREQTRYQFAAFGEQTRLWAWLQMHRGAGGTLMSIVDGAAGLKEFIGDWQVNVYVDGKQIDDTGFNVLC
jgi:hypothetical protein